MPTNNSPTLKESKDMSFHANHTYEQMAAIEKYKAKLAQIDDPEELRRHALKNFSQHICTHNTYHAVIKHHIEIEQNFLKSLTNK